MTLPPRAILLMGLIAPAAALRAVEAMPVSTTDIVSEQLESSTAGAETTSILTGHVVLAGNNIRIDCDYLKAISTSAGAGAATQGGQHYKYILATGHVKIVENTLEATCGRAELLPDIEQITLREKPVITNHAQGTVATGEPVILTGHGKDYTVTGTGVHITGLAPIKDLAPTPAEKP